MEFGICVASKIDDIGYVTLAENLGYRHAWFADSQMLWSDCYACLALAAQQTRTIKLGTGVSVVGTRLAPVTAHSIATINRLAPGRVFLGLGNGHTAWRVMGQRPAPLAAFEETLRVIRGLLDGEHVTFTHRGRTHELQFPMLDLAFVNLDDRIPIYVSAFGPKGQGLAGRLGDGLVFSVPPTVAAIEKCLTNAERGAAAAGKRLDRASFVTANLMAASVLEPGEELLSDRVIAECGPVVLSGLHYAYERYLQFGVEPPPLMHDVWDPYVAMLEATPERDRHVRIHAGHCTFVHPDEARFVTPALLKSLCFVGRPEEIIEQIEQAEAAGLHQALLLPGFSHRYRAIEDFATKVMRRL